MKLLIHFETNFVGILETRIVTFKVQNENEAHKHTAGIKIKRPEGE